MRSRSGPTRCGTRTQRRSAGPRARRCPERDGRRRSRRLEPKPPDERLPGVPGCPASRRGLRAGRGAGPHAGSLRAHPPSSLAGCTDSVNPCKGPPTLRLASLGVVLRKLLIGALVALAFAAPAGAQTTLMPGVTYERGVQFTPHGPVAIHIVTGPRPTGLYALRPVLSNEAIQGARARDRDAEAPLADRDDGRRQRRPLRGVGPAERRPDARRRRREPAVRRPLERRRHAGRRPRRPPGRVLRHLARARPAAHAERPEPVARHERRLALHAQLRPDHAVAPGVTEVVVAPFPPAAEHRPVRPGRPGHRRGGTPIPRDGAVLVARGTAAQRLPRRRRSARS